MHGVRVAWHELEVAFGILARGVPGDLCSESVAFAQSVHVTKCCVTFSLVAFFISVSDAEWSSSQSHRRPEYLSPNSAEEGSRSNGQGGPTAGHEGGQPSGP